jgi:hypothetical protein
MSVVQESRSIVIVWVLGASLGIAWLALGGLRLRRWRKEAVIRCLTAPICRMECS